jgi:DNA helicase-2/ATP-dependent DNA helicase PcrA
LAHLKILSTPRDRISWYRILLLVAKIGPKTAQRIYESIIEQGRGAAGLVETSFKIKGNPGFEDLKQLVEDLVRPSLSLRDLGERILKYYLPILRDRYDDHPRRLQDLQQLLTIMERYVNPDEFLSDMALEPPNTSVQGQMALGNENVDKLVLSTVHSAKGLEWHSVFVIWALDGRFPSHHAIDKPDALEEERRLMYVATTRARENLTVTYPTQVYDRITQTLLYRPSRFLEGIPREMMDKSYYNPHE